ncbi:MAG: SCP2 sterol-binding domain-containing protein [Gammaproteobacteria bacterium]
MALDQARARIQKLLDEKPFDGTIKFDCGDQGNLMMSQDQINDTDGEAPCTVTLSAEDLLALIDGELNPTIGFMQGKLKIDGDMSVALKLASLL